jgi:predicted acyl esterase
VDLWQTRSRPVGDDLPASGVQQGWMSDFTIFEAPDPVYWTARGYAVITADVPGTWFAETEASYFSPREAQCHYDLIEWAGTQPWSNGKVGLRECPIFRRASGKWPR